MVKQVLSVAVMLVALVALLGYVWMLVDDASAPPGEEPLDETEVDVQYVAKLREAKSRRESSEAGEPVRKTRADREQAKRDAAEFEEWQRSLDAPHWFDADVPATQPKRLELADELVAVLVSEESAGWARSAARERLLELGADAVPALIRGLADARTRGWLLAILGTLGPDAAAAVPTVEKYLTDEDLADIAVYTLAGIGEPARTAVIRILQGADAELVEEALDAISMYDEPQPWHLSETASLVGHESIEIRESVALALGRWATQPELSVPALTLLLRDPDSDVRISAAGSLLQFGEHMQSALTELIAALSDPDLDVRAEVAEALGRAGPAAASAVPALLRAMREEPRELSDSVVRALMRIDPPALLEAIDGAPATALQHAYVALVEVRAHVPGAVAAVAAGLDGAEDGSRAYALHALLGVPPDELPDIEERLLELQRDGGTWERGSVALILGRLPEPSAAVVPALTSLLSDAESRVRREAARGLTGHHALPARTLDALIRQLGDNDESAAVAAARALGAQGPSAAAPAAPALRARLAESRIPVRVAAAVALYQVDPGANDAVFTLEALRTHDAREARWLTVQGLGQMETARALPTLIDRLEDRAQRVRGAAAEAIGRLGPDAAVAVHPLIALLHRRVYSFQTDPRPRAIRALGQIGAAASDAIPMLEGYEEGHRLRKLARETIATIRDAR